TRPFMVGALGCHRAIGLDRIERFGAKALEIDRLPDIPLKDVESGKPAGRGQSLQGLAAPIERAREVVGRPVAEILTCRLVTPEEEALRAMSDTFVGDGH